MNRFKQLFLAPSLAMLILVLALPPILTRADSPPVFILKWGSLGSGDGQFALPSGVAVDGEGNVYVVDQQFQTTIVNHRIQKFDSNGTFLTKWGSLGTGDGQFVYAEDIDIDSAGNIYVADASSHRIQKFDSDGNFLTKWGSGGSGDGQFSFPWGWPSTGRATSTWPMSATLAFRNSTATATF